MSGAAAIVVPALKRHTSTVILAHGLGDSGAGWYFLAEQWQSQKKFQETKFIFPNAPNIPITCKMGMRIPGWYDIEDFSSVANRSDDEAGILRSQKVFHKFIAEEIKSGIPTERIVLGGFSQGGSMALMSGITASTKLGGIFGLSSYILLKDKLQSMIPATSPNQKTPIFMGHGDLDPVVKHPWGKMTAEQLRSWDFEVEFNTYPGLGHSAAQKELDDLEAYLKARIPDIGDKPAGEPSTGNL